MGLEEWLDVGKRIEARKTILTTEATGIYRDVLKQVDNELARAERGTAEFQLIADGLLNEARARIQARLDTLNRLLQ